MSRRRIDDERVVALTKQGWSAQAIAEELGCGPSTVRRARQRAGVARPAPRFLTPDEIATVEALLADGASLAEAARSIGRQHSTSLVHRFPGRGWTAQESGQFAMAIRYAGKARP